MAAQDRNTDLKDGTRHDGKVGHLPLHLPTAVQWTRDALEVDLLIQLNFSRRIADATIQPILEIEGTRFAPSARFHLHDDVPGRTLHHVVEIDRGDGGLDAARLRRAREWCRPRDVAFHVVAAAALRTGHLQAATLLTPYIGMWPLGEDVAVIRALIETGGGRTSVGDAEDALVALGVKRTDAVDVVRQTTANWFLDCDLSRAYDGDSTMCILDPESQRDSSRDPFIALLGDAEVVS